MCIEVQIQCSHTAAFLELEGFHSVSGESALSTATMPPTIWAFAGDFCAIKDWHPLVANCKESQEGDVTFRTLTLKDGGTIKEKLTDKDDFSYSYQIVESPGR
jgi:hypothetical protein